MKKLKISYFMPTILAATLLPICSGINASPSKNAQLPKDNSWKCSSGHEEKDDECNVSKEMIEIQKSILKSNKYHYSELNIAAEYYLSFDYSKALPIYLKLSELGNTEAQSMLSGFYSQGLGIPKDDAKAIYWLEKAADLGSYDALRSLAFSYEYGEGVLMDPIKAKILYRKANDAVVARALSGGYVSQALLGFEYCGGDKRKQDLAKCAYWLGKSRENGAALTGIKATWEKYELWKY